MSTCKQHSHKRTTKISSIKAHASIIYLSNKIAVYLNHFPSQRKSMITASVSPPPPTVTLTERGPPALQRSPINLSRRFDHHPTARVHSRAPRGATTNPTVRFPHALADSMSHSPNEEDKVRVLRAAAKQSTSVTYSLFDFLRDENFVD